MFMDRCDKCRSAGRTKVVRATALSVVSLILWMVGVLLMMVAAKRFFHSPVLTWQQWVIDSWPQILLFGLLALTADWAWRLSNKA